MLVLEPEALIGRLSRILCLGAHSDDIEIGCGATVLRLVDGASEGRNHLGWCCRRRAYGAPRPKAQRQGVPGGRHKRRNVIIQDFRAAATSRTREKALKAFVWRRFKQVQPDLVFRSRDDLHQDHRLVNELTWNTFRSQLVLEYEIPKFDGDLGRTELLRPSGSGDLSPEGGDPCSRSSRVSGRSPGSPRTCSWRCCAYAGWRAGRRPGALRPSTAANWCWHESTHVVLG